jgi:hypothetical protein
MKNELQHLPRLELIQYMENLLEDLWELSKQLGDTQINLRIQELSKELSELREFESDENNI